MEDLIFRVAALEKSHKRERYSNNTYIANLMEANNKAWEKIKELEKHKTDEIERLDKLYKVLGGYFCVPEPYMGKIKELEQKIDSLEECFDIQGGINVNLGDVIDIKYEKLEAVLRSHIESHKYIDDRTGFDSDQFLYKKINDTLNKQLKQLDGEQDPLFPDISDMHYSKKLGLVPEEKEPPLESITIKTVEEYANAPCPYCHQQRNSEQKLIKKILADLESISIKGSINEMRNSALAKHKKWLGRLK